jgi:hypothetical protein
MSKMSLLVSSKLGSKQPGYPLRRALQAVRMHFPGHHTPTFPVVGEGCRRMRKGGLVAQRLQPAAQPLAGPACGPEALHCRSRSILPASYFSQVGAKLLNLVSKSWIRLLPAPFSLNDSLGTNNYSLFHRNCKSAGGCKMHTGPCFLLV